MTTEATKQQPYDYDTDPHGVTQADVTGQDVVFDALLTAIVGFNDDSKISMGLTVAIDGVLVSGTAISAQAWSQELRKTVQLGNEKLGDAIGDFASKTYTDKAETIKKREDLQLPIPALKFIHMRDAYIISGNTYQKLPIWRGNLKKLTGWSVGSINPS